MRGISIRIPLLVYGADKISIEENITIDSFPDLIDDNSWKEFMPKDVTKEIFKKFSKYYDKEVFSASSYRIRYMAKAADELEPLERIKRITELFSMFKNPDKETVLTPWRVVNMHLSETIGGYCFWDKDFNIELSEPREVVHKDVTDSIFKSNGKVLEINSKTGLYPLYVAYTFYRLKIKELGSTELTFKKKKEIWDQVIKDNVYIICKTEMAKQITKRTLLGYRNGNINAHAFDDLIMQMKEKQTQLINKINNPSFWKKGGKEMKFDAVVGNPPYQGTNHQQIYPYFYLTSQKLRNIVSLIFPTGWQQPKTANNLACLNKETVKRDKQIMFIDNRQNVFPGISGAEWVNIILWKLDYANNLNGYQLVFTNGTDPSKELLPLEVSNIEKPIEIIELGKLVEQNKNFTSMTKIISSNKPYGLRKNVFTKFKQFNLPQMETKKILDGFTIYGSNKEVRYVDSSYPLPKLTNAFKKYKVFVPSAWGNMSKKTGFGGAWSDIIIGKPFDCCTETFIEIGAFDSIELAKFQAKYILTKFVRALIYDNKISQQCSKQVWKNVPIQYFKEEWWNLPIESIDKHLFEKYSIPNNIQNFVLKNFQKNAKQILLILLTKLVL